MKYLKKKKKTQMPTINFLFSVNHYDKFYELNNKVTKSCSECDSNSSLMNIVSVHAARLN